MKDPKAYALGGGCECPNCGASDIEGTGQSDTDGIHHTERVKCNTCGAAWDDLYLLEGYDQLELPPEIQP